jgi:hypothetical protein
MKNKIFITIALIALCCWACKKDSNLLDENNKYLLIDNTVSQVKFTHVFPALTPNASTTAPSGPRFRIFINGNKIDGTVNTSALTNAISFGSTFPFTPYLSLQPGSNKIECIVNRVSTTGTFAPIAGDTVVNTTINFEAGKRYSVFLADSPDPGVLTLENNFTIPAEKKFSVRLVNLCADIADKYDILSKRYGTVFTNVGYKEVKDYMMFDQTELSDTLTLVKTGTTTALATVNTFSGTAQQVYTFYIYGKTSVGTTRKPALNFFPMR